MCALVAVGGDGAIGGDGGTGEQGSRERGEHTFSSYSCSTSAEMIARSFWRASNDWINARIYQW